MTLGKVMVIGSGPVIIGQAAEFDYSGTQACCTLREEGIKSILVNSNPATIMTDRAIADTIYIEPLTADVVAGIIRKEKPDGLIGTMGGQTGLNLAAELWESGVLEEEGVRILGTGYEAIAKAEDRKLFADLMREIGEPIPRSRTVTSVEDALAFADEVGYSVVVRPGYTLGGTGGGIAGNRDELREIATAGLRLSRVGQALIEESVAGWGEFEYEVMRDAADTCIIVCNMENFDPVGIHTGDSIVVAPSQTLSDVDNQMLRDAAIRIIRALKIEGGCNVQFALNQETGEYRVIEVNPRVSRSSALASKATGYPIARIATKIAIGRKLEEIRNDVTGQSYAAFEPALDYVVVKIPRWNFEKFRGADRRLGTQMKSVGEVMAIGRTFEEALQKAVRSLETKRFGLERPQCKEEALETQLGHASDERLWQIAEALRLGWTVERVSKTTGINPFFIGKVRNIVEKEKDLADVAEAKRLGFSDRRIAELTKSTEEAVRVLRRKAGVRPRYKMVDTCAAEFAARTPYYYSTYESEDEIEKDSRPAVVVLGAGPNRIAQGIEFDYCCVHASLALKEMGYSSVMVNCNPETVSTDYDTSTRLYFEPLTLEDILNVVEREEPRGVIVQFGGQTPMNLAGELARHTRILGTPVRSIDIAEDRDKWAKVMAKLGIPQPEHGIARSMDEALAEAGRLGYPVLVRPSYVLGGRAMEIAYSEPEMREYVSHAVGVSEEKPLLIDKYIEEGTELEVDAICDGSKTVIGGYMEHVEEAGTHSGDATSVLPPHTVDQWVLDTMRDYTEKICDELKVVGLVNIQFVLQRGELFVIEANPRASRTVPFVSKAIGVSLPRVATKVMLGQDLAKAGLPGEIIPPYFSVKKSVFPFLKIKGADPVTGPEMRSTGEVMGIGRSFDEAFWKAEMAAGSRIPGSGNVLLSVGKDKQKAVLLAKQLKAAGYKIFATAGTAAKLGEYGISASPVKKVSEGSPNVAELISTRMFDLVISVPEPGSSISRSDGYLIRRAALEASVPYITTLKEAKTALKCGSITSGPVSLNEYHAELRT